MTVVITMAGIGKRFRDAGYEIPKYQIPANGKTLFEWSMLSLTGYSDIAEGYVFIVRAEDNAREFILQRCAALGISNAIVVEIEGVTDGQATTALLAEPFWKPEKPLLVYNVDTYVEPGLMNSAQLKGDGFIPCFQGEGDHWSFVRLDSSGKACEVREKVRISSHCTLGAYCFSSCSLYRALYDEFYSCDENIVRGEKYIAPLYNHLIEKGKDVYICDIDSSKVHVLGTPEELQRFIMNRQ